MVSTTEPQLTQNAEAILHDRYLRKDGDGEVIETPGELFQRVARAVASGEATLEERSEWEDRFYEIMATLKFLPNSPTLVNAGMEDQGCLSACFVISPEDDMDSIMTIAHNAAMIEKHGGGIGFGFSKLRPKGDAIKTTHGMACGPIAVMEIYAAVGDKLTQGSFRLGAHMGQLHISHPDIQEFIHCKDGDDRLQNFNISVQVPDEFLAEVDADGPWDLINPKDGKVWKTVQARELWEELCESSWKTGDPGVVYIDRVWETQPNPQLGAIQSSNPCGEELLEDYGNCCLGSLNLRHHVTESGMRWEELESSVRTAVRFLDDVIEINTFPLQKLRDVNLATRRIGLGVMGWADALALLGIAYDSDEGTQLAQEVGKFIVDIAWDESARLAEQRGPFPEYDRSALKERGMPPVRNSSVTTIAPTGTISRIADCSSGIEPHFALAWKSNVLWKEQAGAHITLLDAPAPLREKLANALGDSAQVNSTLEKLIENPMAAEDLLRQSGIDPVGYRTSMEIRPLAHVAMLAAWQENVTNSVSKTINLPNDASIEDVRQTYRSAWESKCKAITVYRDGSKSMQVLETGATQSVNGTEMTYIVPRARPAALFGRIVRVRTAHENLYVTISVDDHGKPFEVFTNLGKAGSCDSANLEALSRMISLGLRAGIDPESIVEHLQGISCCPSWDSGVLIKSAPDAVAHVLADHLEDAGAISSSDSAIQPSLLTPPSKTQPQNGYVGRLPACPKCSSDQMIRHEGCFVCMRCQFSKCE